ncbi:hypothetical protein BaRGS_00032659 [Batillaria attramentaria]|uniref:HAT C-terminal dimerisation domain-containing protein n=1 Tax=Batillaria attramentaria TaxID=370345 RepID=A0ABD0JM69_9CAEN
MKRVDKFWESMKTETDETGGRKFQHLPEFMQGILTIPHSSAHCERIFSCVRKNRTDTRASIGQETLQSLLVLKTKPGKPCDRVMGYTKESLRALKSCYKDSLEKYKKH